MKAGRVGHVLSRFLAVLLPVVFGFGFALAADHPIALELTCPSCDDLNICTVDSCDTTTGTCRHDPRNCDDQNPCTQDSCLSTGPNLGFCVHPNLSSGSACSDGNPCTQGDSCQGSPGTTFQCVGTSQPPGASCDDGNSCTTSETCDLSGACVGTPNSLGAPCDDQSLCTTSDTCVASTGGPICVGALKDCGDGTLCTLDRCDPATGQCANPPVDCNDGNVCTGDSCDSATGQCARTNVTGSCSDGNLCFTSDFCSEGNCVSGSVPLNCNDAYSCTRDTCFPSFGCFQHIRDDSLCQFNTNACNDWFCQASSTQNGGCVNRIQRESFHECDGNPCTIDICSAQYFCVLFDYKCTDGNLCTDDQCDSATGICGSHTNNTGPCNDGSLCTTGDICSNGVCQGTSQNCDDGNACTTDSCSLSGCTHTSISCDDGSVCTVDSCDAATGCGHQPAHTTCGVGACQRIIDNCVDGVPQQCVPGTPSTEICNGIDDDCDGLTDENRVQSDCTISPSTMNLNSQGGIVSMTCKLEDVCDPANPAPISGSTVSQVYVSRVDSANDPGDDVTLPDPSTLPCPDPVLGLLYERGISENLDARDVSNANVTFKFNVPADGYCATLDGNRQDIAARLASVPDNTSATICISGKTDGADFQACMLVLVKNKGLR